MSILREELITNHLLLDYFDMWDEFDIQKVEDPKTIRYYDLIMNHLQNQIDAGIKWLESDEARDYFFGESKYQQEVFHALEDEWDSILEGKYPSVEALLSEVYRRGKAKGYSDMRDHVKYTETDRLALTFARDYNFKLIQRIDDDVRNQIKNKITSSFLAGEHPYSVAPKILAVAEEKLEGSNFTPKQRATMIARTEISRVQNTGILQSYVNEGYTEIKILTAEDDHVCDLCLKYAFEFNEDEDILYENRGEERVHNIFKLIKKGTFPPFHPLCRCTYLSVWETKGKPTNSYVVDLTKPNVYSDEELEGMPNIEGNDSIKLIQSEKNVKVNLYEGNELDIDNDEQFNKYVFDNGLEIYISEDYLFDKLLLIKKAYEDLHEVMKQKMDKIIVSGQELKFKKGGKAGGYISPNAPDNRIIIGFNRSYKQIMTLQHETAHLLEYNEDFYISNSKEYIEACIEDSQRRRKLGEKYIVPKGQRNFIEKVKKGDKDAIKRPLSEDLANSIKDYLSDPNFKDKFPARTEVIERILDDTFEATEIDLPLDDIINQVFK